MRSTPDNIAQLIRELEHLSLGDGSRTPPEPPLPPDNGSGNGGGMDRRVSRLEEKVDGLIDRSTAVEINLATLTERVAHLPGKGFIVGATMSTLAVVAALIAFGEKLQQLVQ